MRITPELAEEIWEVLVELAGAKETDDLMKNSFVSYLCEDGDRKEFRFCGSLGWGGKFKVNCGKWYVCFYSEDTTPEREATKQSTNERLKQLQIATLTEEISRRNFQIKDLAVEMDDLERELAYLTNSLNLILSQYGTTH